MHAVLAAPGGRGAPSLSLQDADLAVRPSEAPLLSQSAKVRWDTLRPETEIRLHKLSCRACASECHLPRVLPALRAPPCRAMRWWHTVRILTAVPGNADLGLEPGGGARRETLSCGQDVFPSRNISTRHNFQNLMLTVPM